MVSVPLTSDAYTLGQGFRGNSLFHALFSLADDLFLHTNNQQSFTGSHAWGVAHTDGPYDLYLAQATGVIFPLDQAQEEQYGKRVGEACEHASARRWCLEFLIGRTLQQEGEAEAFGILTYLSNTDAEFSLYCTPLLSRIGADAYERFTEHKDFFSTTRIKYCGNAFFSGVADSMVSRGASPQGGLAFCRAFDAGLAPQEKILSSCLNGFGASMVYRQIDSLVRVQNAETLVQPALSWCSRLGDAAAIEECAGGVFSYVPSAYTVDTIGTLWNPAHPLALCEAQQTTLLQRSCYRMFKYLLLETSGYDFPRALSTLERIQNEEVAAGAVYDLASLWVRSLLSGDDDTAAVVACRASASSLRVPCIEGAEAGLFAHGIPGAEYKRAFRFCQLSGLTQEERSACYRQLLFMASLRYPASLQAQLCTSVHEAARSEQIPPPLCY